MRSRPFAPSLLAGCLFLALPVSLPSRPPPLEFQRQVYLMGTPCWLTTYASERSAALDYLESLVRILEETERELSTWRPDSVLSRLNRHPLGKPFPLNPALCRLFEELLFWHSETDGAFDPGVGTLLEAWGQREGGRVPGPAIMEQARRLAGLQHLKLDPSTCHLRREEETLIDAGAFGKGEALDRVLDFARRKRLPPWLIDLGGQVMVWELPPGRSGWSVPLAHPLHRSQVLASVNLPYGSLATSGGSERDLYRNGIRIAHILDPRTGRAPAFEGSVVVWHERALVADIVSTALYVMGPEKGWEWAEERGLAACFLIPGEAGVGSPAVQLRPTHAFARRFLSD